MFRDVNSGQILKPILDQRGKRELRFYQLLFDRDHDLLSSQKDKKLLHSLRSFVPTFFGVELLQQIEFIRLQDVTGTMNHPNLMDIKIGRNTFDRLANQKKIDHEMSKNNISRSFGYRVLGVKVSAYEAVDCDCH
jgi:1D-myo-inositol-tetrakisphosphate 5-kinase/inositol-polyphosphate multikinase